MPPPIPETLRDEAVALYVAGRSNAEIASKLGINVVTVSRIAKRAGVLRSKAEGQAVRAAREAVGWDRVGKKGAVQSKKSGKWFACDSAYEFVRMHQLDDDPDVVSWSRCEDMIPYKFDGNNLVYVPDLRVVRGGGRVIVEEIKPNKMLQQAKNQAKFYAARMFYGPIGVAFKVVTEDDIGWDEIRRWDGVALHGVPDEERAAKRRAASLKCLYSKTPEQRAAINLAAKEREAKKRASDRDAYNAKAREYRAKRKTRRKQQQTLAQDALF